MERRQALAVLGSALASIAGCTSLETGSGAPAGEPSSGTGATGLEDRQFSTFEDYGPAGAKVRLARDDIPTTVEGDRNVRIAVSARRYPRGQGIRRGESEVISAFDSQDQTVEVEFESRLDSNHVGDHIHYLAAVRPDSSAAGADSDDGPTADRPPLVAKTDRLVAETDRLILGEDGSLTPDPHPETVGEASRAGFERGAVDGAYHLAISGDGVDWTLPVRVFKSEYVHGATGWHGHEYPRYVERARESGLADRVTTEIQRAATALDRDLIPFAIETVQRLPYVAEPETPADEYIKYPAETLVDGGGDCEDSALLLASLLTARPFDRDCAILHPPNHVGLGLAGEGYVGTFYAHEGTEYFFVETTAPGWDIGELPEAYASDTALVFPV